MSNLSKLYEQATGHLQFSPSLTAGWLGRATLLNFEEASDRDKQVRGIELSERFRACLKKREEKYTEMVADEAVRRAMYAHVAVHGAPFKFTDIQVRDTIS